MPISRTPDRVDAGQMPPRPRKVAVEPEAAPTPAAPAPESVPDVALKPEPVPEAALEAASDVAEKAEPPKRGRPTRKE